MTGAVAIPSVPYDSRYDPSSLRKDWAARFLAGVLIDKGHINTPDSATLDTLVRESYHHVVLAGDTKDCHFTWHGYDDLGELNKLTDKELDESAAKNSANYLFRSTSFSAAYQGDSPRYALRFSRTYMALIGKKEERQLRALYYKDIPAEVQLAMSTLGLKDYTRLYDLYSHTERWRELCWSRMVNSTEIAFTQEFMEFALTLPMEERNPDAEEMVFTFLPLDHAALLGVLYRQGDALFTRYAEKAKEEVLDSAVAMIPWIPKKEQLQHLNAWLFEKGYKNVHLDYLALYKGEKAETFMEHFRKQPEDMKEQVIRTLIGLDLAERNAAVDELLEKEYQPLLEKVGMQMVGDEHDGD